MEHLDYFKLQAKNLFKDYKTRFSYYDDVIKDNLYDYNPKYFDIKGIFLDFGIYDDESDFKFTLMNAQHIIAQLVGFRKWTDLEKANPTELELAHLLFDNAHKISIEEWKMYIAQAESDNQTVFDAKTRLDIFKQVFLNADKHRSDFVAYRSDLENKRNTTPADLDEEDYYDQPDIYNELNEKEKLEAIKAHQNSGYDYKLDELVECLHCGEKYQFKNVKAIRRKPEYRTLNDFDEIVCKNYPKCSGSIIDLMRIDRMQNRMAEEK